MKNEFYKGEKAVTFMFFLTSKLILLIMNAFAFGNSRLNESLNLNLNDEVFKKSYFTAFWCKGTLINDVTQTWGMTFVTIVHNYCL